MSPISSVPRRGRFPASRLLLVLGGVAIVSVLGLAPSRAPAQVPPLGDEPPRIEPGEAGEPDAEPRRRPPVAQEARVVSLEGGGEIIFQTMPGLERVVLLAVTPVGDMHDPREAPGLSRLLSELALAAPVASDADLPEDRRTLRDPRVIRRDYRGGAISRTLPDHALFGWSVAPEDAELHARELVLRLTDLAIDAESIDAAHGRVKEWVGERFRERLPTVPRAWVEGFAFPHPSGDDRGCDPIMLRALTTEEVAESWAERWHPARSRIVVLGGEEMEDLRPSIERIIRTAVEQADPPPGDGRWPVTREARGAAGVRVVVPALPGRDDDHITAAYFAPPLDDPAHPAFVVIAMTLVRGGLSMPGAEARPPFDYDLLADHRAAYATPFPFRYPEGPGQALGFWDMRIRNMRFSRSRVNTVRRMLGWQIGDPVPADLLASANVKSDLALALAHGVAFRSLHGGDEFWQTYRERMETLDRETLESARADHFQVEEAAVFLLREVPEAFDEEIGP